MAQKHEQLPTPPFTPGVYRHWRGDSHYLALGVAESSEEPGAWEVVYWSYTYNRWKRRPYAMFTEEVRQETRDDGTLYTGPRFTLVKAAQTDVYLLGQALGLDGGLFAAVRDPGSIGVTPAPG